MQYDIFNGDADGICALHQLRLNQPKEQVLLVTGVKRDVNLLAKVKTSITSSDNLTVLDISMDKNNDDLTEILDCGASVFYADHHFAGEIPESDKLEAHIDPCADMCTSLIVDSLLKGRYGAWAVVGAYGDNLHDAAKKKSDTLKLSDAERNLLRELGELLNYNGYGAVISDLHFKPQDLYRAVQPYESPLDFINSSTAMETLRKGFNTDMENARNQKPYLENNSGRIFMFPAQAWSKRVAGVFSNEKAREMPQYGHALMVDNGDETYLVSVRAPLQRKDGADVLCRAFPTGGGRAAAAGINALPAHMLDEFVSKFTEIFCP